MKRRSFLSIIGPAVAALVLQLSPRGVPGRYHPPTQSETWVILDRGEDGVRVKTPSGWFVASEDYFNEMLQDPMMRGITLITPGHMVTLT